MQDRWSELRRSLVEGLVDAYDISGLNQMLQVYCDTRLDKHKVIGYQDSMYSVVEAVVADAERNGWIDKLANGALKMRQSNRRLQQAVPAIEQALAEHGQTFYQAHLSPEQRDADNQITEKRVGFDQTGQTVHGNQFNAEGDMNIGQIGNTINTGGGDYVGGNKTYNQHGGVNFSGSGDVSIGGDVAGGDMHKQETVGGDKITVGDISNSSGFAIGSGASAKVTNISYGSADDRDELQQLIAQLEAALQQAAQQRPAEVRDVQDELEDLTDELASDEPTPRRIDKFSRRLKEAAAAFAQTAPAIVETVERIVNLVRSM